MNYKVFSIRDAKAEYFTPPFFKKTHGEAERDFKTVAKDPQSTISKFPEDFDLYYIGDYDDQTGLIKSLDTPKHVMKAAHFETQ